MTDGAGGGGEEETATVATPDRLNDSGRRELILSEACANVAYNFAGSLVAWRMIGGQIA